MTIARTSDAQLNRLWGAVCAFAGLFLLVWGLSWVKASVLDNDLQNRCGDLHTASFPFEKSCTNEDGTVENANSLLFDGIFFGSLSAALICLTVVFTIEAIRRK
ncbi:hypothetical protein ABZ580_35035 [Streptomyces sp. NPDC012486]|uniref:hypothetical protein n=1 Tax=unclassified Streptomyces TaxID=2593676 RepID=UPI0033F102AB